MSQLIWHERVETTVPRAKELRKIADRMVTLGKEVRVLICDVCCYTLYIYLPVPYVRD